MNITSKLTLAFTLMFALLLLSLSAWQLQRYLELQAREVDDDIGILARALSSAGAELWRLDGEAAARAYIERRDDARARTRIVITHPSPDDQAAIERAEGGPLLLEHGEDTISARTLIAGPAGEFLLLELTRSIEPERAYTRDALLQQFIGMIVFIAIAGVLTWSLGRRVIGEPLTRLTEHARAIGSGDFSSRLALPMRSEFSVLARELNATAEALARAHADVSREHERRLELVEQLRHADRLSSIGKLSAAIGHELGTPLNVVSGHASMIQMDADATEKIRGHASTIGERVRHMTKLLRQMMNFARGRGLQRSSVHVADTLKRAISFVSPLARRHGVDIVTTDVVDAEVELDSQRVLQVLTNLLVNAIHATPEGGEIRVGATMRSDVAPPAEATSAPQYLRLRVEDDGHGMDEEQQEHAFEPFFTTKDPGQGTGLGLPICHGIVQEHGGWITTRSAPGEGARFDCFFPVARDADPRESLLNMSL